MGLKSIDKSAEQKGSGIATLWQFVKFIVVSLLACIVQFASLNLIMLLPQIKAVMNDDFTWFVFNYVGEGKGFGYFIAFNIANILAQIVAFFVNREKTFGSSSNIAITLPIYIVFTVALICFSAWLAPTIQGWLISHSISTQLAANISTMVRLFSSSSIFLLTRSFSTKRKRKNNCINLLYYSCILEAGMVE